MLCRSTTARILGRSLLQWAMFCQNSPLSPVHLQWPCMAWFLASLIYASPFAKIRFLTKRGPLENSGKPLQYSCLENPMNSMKRQKDRTLKDELPRSVCAKYATGEEWRNNSRKNEEMEPKQKQCLVVDVTGDGIKSDCKEQYCIGT